MICINCFSDDTRITNSRPRKKQPSVWRRRQCLQCKVTFTTIEQPSLTDSVSIWSSDGSKSHFNIGRLTISLAEAFSHDAKHGKNQALQLAYTVESILASDYAIITTNDVEAVAHQVLRRYDELAAIQYAAKHQLIVSARRPGRPSIVSHEQQSRRSPSQ